MKDVMDHLHAVRPPEPSRLCSPWGRRSMSANLKCPFEEGQKGQPLICSYKSSYSASPASLVPYFPPPNALQADTCFAVLFLSLVFLSLGNWSQLRCSIKFGVPDVAGNGMGCLVYRQGSMNSR